MGQLVVWLGQLVVLHKPKDVHAALQFYMCDAAAGRLLHKAPCDCPFVGLVATALRPGAVAISDMSFRTLFSSDGSCCCCVAMAVGLGVVFELRCSAVTGMYCC
jgi:hypothetical protein